jgi:hypothetical protein
MRAPQSLYEYGPIAWFWRALLFPALGGGALMLAIAMRDLALAPVGVALPLILPSLFFGMAVATRVDRDEDQLLVRTLLFWRRRIDLERLGRPIFRQVAQSWYGPFHAPRVWILVRGGLPIYLDLLTKRLDKDALARVLNGRQQRQRKD